MCLLDASPQVQASRLTGHGDDPALLEAHHGFAQWMREHAIDPLPRRDVLTHDGAPEARWERVARLVEHDQWRATVTDTSRRSPDDVAAVVESWIHAALADDALVMHPGDDTEPSDRSTDTASEQLGGRP